MHIPTLIARKRDGGRLDSSEIRSLIADFTAGEMPDSQMSALAMAIYFRGMDSDEISALTDAMLHSGSVLKWPDGAPPRVDKHSTGGIGDKTSLVLAPLLACEGLWVPMISGRGLGITGGTLDKLESIPGFQTRLDETTLQRVVSELGCVMVGQTDNLVPADRKFYALRDVTGTVPSVALITASIMSKKLAEGLNRLVLDVKYGSGAFMQTEAQANELADSLCRVGNSLGVDTVTQLHPMNEPTGHAVGNALEVAESVDCLQGRGPSDLEKLVLDLAAGVCDTPRNALKRRLHDGTAWERFQRMVSAQGGHMDVLETLTVEVHRAPHIEEVTSDRSGVITRMDAGCLGLAVLELGAGRSRASDSIDFAVGLDHLKKVGDEVQVGDVLLRIHARHPASAAKARQTILEGVNVDS